MLLQTLSQALNEHNDVVCLGDCWAPVQAWEIFTSRPALEMARMPTQIILPPRSHFELVTTTRALPLWTM